MLTDGILRRKVNSVCVEKLEEGSVDGVRELVDLDHLLLILRPLGAKHGPEMFTPAPNKNHYLYCAVCRAGYQAYGKSNAINNLA